MASPAADRLTLSRGSQAGQFMDLHKGYYSFFPGETWTPSVNLYETETSYMVCVDLAGVEKKKIDIEVTGLRLTLKGNRAVPVCPERKGGGETVPEDGDGHATASPVAGGRRTGTAARTRLHLMEIDHGPFSREVELPQDVQTKEITAKYLNGLLWIELPKKS